MRRRAVALLMAALMTAGLAVTGLTGCGSDADGVEKVRLMVWSPTADQSKITGNGCRHAVRHLQISIRNGILICVRDHG